MKPLTIPEEYNGMRLDKFLQATFDVPFVQVQKLCRKGNIRLDGSRVKANAVVSTGQEVRVPPFFSKSEEKKPYQLSEADKQLLLENTIYQDEEVFVLNKPYGLPVQGGEKHNKSLDAMLKSYITDKKARLVHRLDRDTTGCLMFALNRNAAAALTDAFKTKHVQKTYWAVVQGKLPRREGKISIPLQKVGKEGDQRMVAHPEGKRAVTFYRTIASASDIHWLEVMPHTGRTHQIRVHLAELGTPIIGDMKYGEVQDLGEHIPPNKMFLHARGIVFDKKLKLPKDAFEAPLPDHFKQLFKLFNWQEKQVEQH